ncbi:unnamed protein product, partial [Mycena citricolor]
HMMAAKSHSIARKRRLWAAFPRRGPAYDVLTVIDCSAGHANLFGTRTFLASLIKRRRHLLPRSIGIYLLTPAEEQPALKYPRGHLQLKSIRHNALRSSCTCN